VAKGFVDTENGLQPSVTFHECKKKRLILRFPEVLRHFEVVGVRYGYGKEESREHMQLFGSKADTFRSTINMPMLSLTQCRRLKKKKKTQYSCKMLAYTPLQKSEKN
jgi:hypothetical protein